MLGRGLIRRCARCGSGRLFRRWFSMVDRCPGCDYRFEREEGFFLGAYVVNLGITQLAVVAYIGAAVVATLPDPPILALSVGGGLVAGITPLLAYPFSKTFWTAIDLIMHPAHLVGSEAPGSEREKAPLREGGQIGGFDSGA